MTRRLLLLNGIAGLMVVLKHTTAYGLNAMFLWTNASTSLDASNFDRVNSLSFYILFGIYQFVDFAIPAFLFVSGYFVAFLGKKDNPKITWKPIFPRIKKLFIPFLFWTVLLNVFLLRRLPPTIEELLTSYYYIPLIVQFYLLSPILLFFAKKQWKLLLVFTFLMQFSIHFLRLITYIGMDLPAVFQWITNTPIWLFPGHIFYFTIGVVAGVYIEEFKCWLMGNTRIVIFSMIFLFGLGIVEYLLLKPDSTTPWVYPGVVKGLYPIAIVLFILAIDKTRIPYSKVLSSLGEKSLGIYFVNTPAIYLASLILYYLLPWVFEFQLLYQITLVMAGLGVPLLLMVTFFRSPARRFYPYFFG